MKSPKNESQLFPRAHMSQGGYAQVIVIFLAPSPDKQVFVPVLEMTGPLHWKNGCWLPGRKKNPSAKQTFAEQSKYRRWVKPHPNADLFFPLSLTSEHKSKGEIKTFHKQKSWKLIKAVLLRNKRDLTDRSPSRALLHFSLSSKAGC